MTRYSVVGLGKLGSCMAAAIAARGFEVVGVDLDPVAIDLVNAGRAPVVETDLDELMAANRERIRATASHLDAVASSDVTFVVVPTPSDEAGGFSTEYAAEAFRAVGRALAEKDGYHLVVLTSTVLPGATRGLVPILEQTSGKSAGADFGICYSPEFIALGSVIRDFLNPDFLLVGELDEESGALLERSYAEIVENGAPCRRMSIENAELAKIALNSFVTTKIAFANTLADLCERIPGGDVDVVTDAIGLDRRIGRPYLTGGLGYGGPCFPRDNAAFAAVARSLDVRADLAEATDELNRARVAGIVEHIAQLVSPGARIAIIGMAYKPGSNVVEESQGLAIARALAELGASVVAYDPLVGDSIGAVAGDDLDLAESIGDCIGDADVIIVTHADPMIASELDRAIRSLKGSPVVFDCWRFLHLDTGELPRLKYVALGRSGEGVDLRRRLGDVVA